MKYFTIAELTRSETAQRKGIVNEPDGMERAALERLVDNVLDPIRQVWGKPILVNSGFRCRELNAAVGGVATSQHLKGEAADIRDASGDNKGLFELIKDMGRKGLINFDQLIDESNLTWIHVSYRPHGDNRNQILKL